MLKQFPIVVLFVLALVVSSCVSVRYDEDVSQYTENIRELRQKLEANPSDAESWRDLGIIYFETKQYAKAKEYLKQSIDLGGSDAKAAFYLGMTHEFDVNPTAALAVYITYTDYSPLSQYRSMMEGRYQELTREVIKSQFRALIAKEGSITTSSLPVNTLAVFPLAYQTGDIRYAPLGMGISEMILTDLGQVKKLKLVERIRIEELLKELSFSATSSVDQTSAPRMGKLLAAGRIVGGTFSVSPDGSIRMDVSSVDVATGSKPGGASESDVLENLFRAEKEIVFKLIQGMGIKLSREERESIQRFPTKNLQAFLAYSLGLDYEARGDFESAGAMYKEAGSIDPAFSSAKERQSISESRKTGSGNKETALASAEKIEPPPKPSGSTTGKGSMVARRFETMQQVIGAGIVPSQDSRKPAQEGLPATGIELPAPPPPPPPQ